MTGLWRKSWRMTLVLVILTCGVYPAAVWVVGQTLFHGKANGSLIVNSSAVVGSRLIAQGFQRPEYFHPRPSAAGDKGYDATSSNASNLAMTNKKFVDGLQANVAQAIKDNPGLVAGAVPNDMVMASASGLDPQVSPANALAQVERVARARGVESGTIRQMVEHFTQPPDWGLFGEATVNVLEVNLELDEKFPVRKQ